MIHCLKLFLKSILTRTSVSIKPFSKLIHSNKLLRWMKPFRSIWKSLKAIWLRIFKATSISSLMHSTTLTQWRKTWLSSLQKLSQWDITMKFCNRNILVWCWKFISCRNKKNTSQRLTASSNISMYWNNHFQSFKIW